jgi:hypothetical protein
MKKNDYQRPAMKVVELQHRTHLLVASVKSGKASLQNYNWNETVVEE